MIRSSSADGIEGVINFLATKQNLQQWVLSESFDQNFEAQFASPKWRFIMGGVLTISPLFPWGILLLRSGMRARSARKLALLQFRNDVAQLEPIVCATVIANTEAMATPGASIPATVMGAFGKADETYLSELTETLIQVAELYGSEPDAVAPEHREFTALINDDIYQANRRRNLPAALANGRPFQLFDAVLSSSHFSEGPLGFPFVVCASTFLKAGPFFHLPPELIVWEEVENKAYDPNIIQHQMPTRKAPIVAPVSENLEPLSEHIEMYFGTAETVYHELISTTVHIDLHIIAATDDRPWITIVTTGMSDIAMNAPEGYEDYQLAELLLRLPPDWPLTQEALQDKRNYWPLGQLKMLARFAHEFETWLSYGHTIPNGNPAEPFADGVPFSGVILSHPYWADDAAAQCALPDGKVVHFWSLNALYPTEMNEKLVSGAEPLIEKLIEQGYGDYVEPRREPVC